MASINPVGAEVWVPRVSKDASSVRPLAVHRSPSSKHTPGYNVSGDPYGIASAAKTPRPAVGDFFTATRWGLDHDIFIEPSSSAVQGTAAVLATCCTHERSKHFEARGTRKNEALLSKKIQKKLKLVPGHIFS